MSNYNNSNNSKPQDFQDPKLALTLSYIRRVDEIENIIDKGRASDALKAMCTFINRLDIPEDETELLQAKSDLNKNQETSYITSAKTQGYFTTINAFLNKTYFAEYHSRAKPRNGATPMLKVT